VHAPLALPHHDGSDLYVPERAASLEEETTVLLRVPRELAVGEVAVRYLRDGEPRVSVARVDRTNETEAWWRATFPVPNPATPYRWLLSGGDVGYAWVTGAGMHRFDAPDTDDFVASTDPGGPAWHAESVVYEVFPDRFASAGLGVEAPAWAVPRSWDDLPTGRGKDTSFELFGGDLVGAEERLDHIESLGATVLYLTPVFPARSIHRYDASSFDEIDPLLGGDEALASLVRAAHARGMRVLGDLTTNHVGSDHPWFAAARRDDTSPEHGFFFFDDRLKNGYEAWANVPTLPKLDYDSPVLRERIYGNGSSVVRHWLRPPFALDGWRIDVAHMTGRRADADLSAEVARGIRAAALAERPDAVVVAEHGHDARPDLLQAGWHGTMAYAGFTRPVWAWLCGPSLPPHLEQDFLGLPVGVPTLEGGPVVETMRRFRAGIPWSAVLHSWSILDSHDTARFRTVTGSRERHIVGLGVQMSSPGVPMVFAGDEIGLEGAWGEDARRTMPWSRPETWDAGLLDAYRGLIALRRTSPALVHGGIRYAHVSDDAIAYLRETREEAVLCLAARAAHGPVRLALAALGGSELETLWGDDARIERGDAVLPPGGPAFHAWRVV
jgi:alpha-glucosidase